MNELCAAIARIDKDLADKQSCLLHQEPEYGESSQLRAIGVLHWHYLFTSWQESVLTLRLLVHLPACIFIS